MFMIPRASAPTPDAAPANEVEDVVQEEANEAASVQGDTPVVEPGTPEDRQRFESVLPGMKGCYDALSPEMREKMLLSALEATSTPATPIEDENESAPSVREVPHLDMDAANARLVKAIEDGDTETIADVQKQITEYNTSIQLALYDSFKLNQYRTEQLNKQLSDLRKPQDIRAAGAAVPGFQESDIGAAQALMDSGQIKDIKLAVRYVVQERQIASGKSAAPSASQEAERKARAIAAASVPDSQAVVTSGKFQPTPNFTDPAWLDAMMKDVQAANQIKQT